MERDRERGSSSLNEGERGAESPARSATTAIWQPQRQPQLQPDPDWSGLGYQSIPNPRPPVVHPTAPCSILLALCSVSWQFGGSCLCRTLRQLVAGVTLTCLSLASDANAHFYAFTHMTPLQPPSLPHTWYSSRIPHFAWVTYAVLGCISKRERKRERSQKLKRKSLLANRLPF